MKKSNFEKSNHFATIYSLKHHQKSSQNPIFFPIFLLIYANSLKKKFQLKTHYFLMHIIHHLTAYPTIKTQFDWNEYDFLRLYHTYLTILSNSSTPTSFSFVLHIFFLQIADACIAWPVLSLLLFFYILIYFHFQILSVVIVFFHWDFFI